MHIQCRARGHRMEMQHFFNVFISLCFRPRSASWTTSGRTTARTPWLGRPRRRPPMPSRTRRRARRPRRRPRRTPLRSSSSPARAGEAPAGEGWAAATRRTEGRKKKRLKEEKKEGRICGGTKSRRRMKRGKLFFTLLLSLFASPPLSFPPFEQQSSWEGLVTQGKGEREGGVGKGGSRPAGRMAAV